MATPTITDASCDYAVLETDEHRFYYGYEETNEAGDWMFVASHKTLANEDLRLSCVEMGADDRFHCMACLLLGIGHYLNQGLS